MGIVFIHLFNKPPPTIIPSWLFLFLSYLSMFNIVSVTLGGKNIGPLCKWSLFVRTKLTTVGLNMHKTLKKMFEQAKYIFDIFEYFWVDHKSKYCCNCLATRWRHHHFCWKLDFWAKIFFAEFLERKNDF